MINPIQSDSLRNFHIRKQKTDAVDCFLVAEVIRFGKFSETHLADEDILTLRNLARFRESLKDSCADYKRTDKARELKSLAARSIGLTLCSDAFAFQIRILIEQIDEINKKIARQLRKLSSVILTIPGVGPATGAVILGEIGDISRFSNPKKLVAFAGIDPTSFQSGNYVGQHNRLSKKESPYLRRAVWMSALIAARCDPVFKEFYDKKRGEGKAHGTALGAVSRKLLYTIHAVLKANKPYEVRRKSIE